MLNPNLRDALRADFGVQPSERFLLIWCPWMPLALRQCHRARVAGKPSGPSTLAENSLQRQAQLSLVAKAFCVVFSAEKVFRECSVGSYFHLG